MDVATIDNEFAQLQTESQQATQAISDLAQKLQSAAQAGDGNAKEWIIDLKSIALQIQQEQLQTQALLQALHNFTVNQMQAPPPVAAAQYQQPVYQAPQQNDQPAQYQQPSQYQQQGRGGALSHFMGGGFGQAMSQGMGMGAGFGLADSVINAIFH
ncbi:MAG: hypothetical protein ACRDZ8_09730 [Acidimicrobiales bacterium]